MVYVIGDVHLRAEEPFFSVTKEFFESLLSILDEKDKLVFTGDFFHRARPYSEELKCARDFFEKLKVKHIHAAILAGNHEYFRDRDTWAEDVFTDYDIEFIDQPQLCECYYGVQIMFMPWVPLKKIMRCSSAKNIKEYYENEIIPKCLDKVNPNKNLYLVYHFEDETVFTGIDGVGVDLSMFEKKYGKIVTRLGGHIHNPTVNYIGTPYATRADENGFERHIAKIDQYTQDLEIIPMQERIVFEKLEYGELASQSFDENKKYVVTVLDAPSLESVKCTTDKHPNVWLDDYELKFNEDRQIMKDKSDEFQSIRDFLSLYIKQNKVDSSTANYLLSVFCPFCCSLVVC